MRLKYAENVAKSFHRLSLFNEALLGGGIVQSHFETVVKESSTKPEIDAKKPLETEKIVGLRNGALLFIIYIFYIFLEL